MTKKFVLNFILSAICYVALGIALIVWPATSINIFCYVLGGVTAAYGLWQVYRFISHREERYATLSLMVGIVALALGICFFVKPELFASILPFILGLYLIFDGVVKLQAAIDIKRGLPKMGHPAAFGRPDDRSGCSHPAQSFPVGTGTHHFYRHLYAAGWRY